MTIKCPNCKTINPRTQLIEKEMSEVGKAVVTCIHCNIFFVLRDDGDGEFIYWREKEEE